MSVNEELLSRVADAVWEKLSHASPSLPRALCVGAPPKDAPFLPVTDAPFEMVVICSLSPHELLQMPSDAVCRGLLEGKPVYLMEEGLEYRRYPAATARGLRGLLMSKERQLYSLGVKKWGCGDKRLITAKDLLSLSRENLPKNAIFTPLARDMLEGKS